MITGSEEESRELMMNAAIRVVSAYGFEGFTTKRWATEAGVAEGSLYYHFKSKNDLLDQTYLFIDKKFFEAGEEMKLREGDIDSLCKSIDLIWSSYFQNLIDHPDWTKYYFRYRSSTRYTPEIMELQKDEFRGYLKAMKEIEIRNTGVQKADWDYILSYILDGISAFAFRVVTGDMKVNETDRETFRKVMMHGVSSLISKSE